MKSFIFSFSVLTIAAFLISYNLLAGQSVLDLKPRDFNAADAIKREITDARYANDFGPVNGKKMIQAEKKGASELGIWVWGDQHPLVQEGKTIEALFD